MRIGALVMDKRVFERKWPIKADIARVAARELTGLEDGVVGLHKPVAERGPGEEVDGDRVRGAGLVRAWCMSKWAGEGWGNQLNFTLDEASLALYPIPPLSR